jgi:hypothetical protein
MIVNDGQSAKGIHSQVGVDTREEARGEGLQVYQQALSSVKSESWTQF